MSECRHLRTCFTSKLNQLNPMNNLKNIHNIHKLSASSVRARVSWSAGIAQTDDAAESGNTASNNSCNADVTNVNHFPSKRNSEPISKPINKLFGLIRDRSDLFKLKRSTITLFSIGFDKNFIDIRQRLSSSSYSSSVVYPIRAYSTVAMGLISGKCERKSLYSCACCSNPLSNCRCNCEKSTRCLCAGPRHFHRIGFNHQNRWFSSADKMNNNTNGLIGTDLLREPNVNKGLAFTTREREALHLKGLLPPSIRTQEMQVKIIMDNIRKIKEDLGKYMFLRDLQDHNKRLFYRVLQLYTSELMPIVYTPIVGEACQKYSLIFKRPRGLFITVHDAGRIPSVLANVHEPDVKAIVVTDGERILGLGDLGANGMGIPVGKMALYSAIGGIPPELTLPVTIDVGTNNETLLNDPYYIGLKQKRVRGAEYDHLIDEFMESVVKRWGRQTLIQFEDFANSNAFRLLEKYKTKYCVFNDDIQGTASVALAGIMASLKITGTKLTQHTFLFQGAGEAALGTADLIVMAMEQEGLSTDEARNKIWMVDSRGLVTLSRAGTNDVHKMQFAKQATETKNLEEIIDLVRPSCLIGVSACSGAFTPTILKKVSSFHKRPIVFALSNPTSKAECTAEEAYRHTDGQCVFASGSPFGNVTYKGKTFIPGQGNNAYIFPGVALAVMACGVNEIRNEVFLVAAKALAELVTKKDCDVGRVYPSLETINETSLRIAARVAQWFYTEGYATHRPEPDDKYLFLKGKLYDATYDRSQFTDHINGKSSWSSDNNNFTH